MKVGVLGALALAGCNSILGIGDLHPAGADIDAMAVQEPLVVTIGGGGGGHVTSSPAGIDCPGTCSATFAMGTTVTLTPRANGGSRFGGWQTACTGVAGCTVTLTVGTAVGAQFDDLSGGHNFVFVTAETYTPVFTPLTTADDDCNASAAAAGLPGHYVAWLSTTTTSAKSRLGTARGWVRPDGQPFVDTIADLVAGKSLMPPNVNASGRALGPNYAPVVTGTLMNGNVDPQNCDDWTATTGMYKMGDANGTGRDWTSFGQSSFAAPCTNKAPLYCFGMDHGAPLTITPVTGRLAFLAPGFALGSGVASADAFCQQAANGASKSGTFLALLATRTASAASRFDPAGAPWVRPDGIPLAPPGASLFDGLAAPINVTLAGVYDPDNGFVSLGATAPDVIATSPADDCGDWSDTTTTFIGDSTDQIDAWFPPDDGFKLPCNGTLRLYCLQQ